ncbi:signal recognition particle 9 kDa protein-domain-containing protein [Phyllosticta capitalensis]|uniref:Signal recognition particle 9 kDa protein-domain-containing protein n=1 Tax=Phyllosticta capitalensis TaxID=121624 RepID=A0ABR1YKJ5_9PEZI
MPFFESSAEWLEQSALLLKARPTTQARIVTKYSILQRHEQKQLKRKDKAAEKATSSGQNGDAAAETQDRRQQPAQPDRPKGVLIIKTYDPASGVCLKYKTNKAAEVGRLVASLEKLARTMAALPDKPEDVAMLDAPIAGEQGTGTNTPNPEAAPKTDSKPAQGGGGGKKKKKGKK